MGLTELPVLDQQVLDGECCTPLATTVLPEADAAVLSDRFAALGAQTAVPLGVAGVLGIWWATGDWHATAAILAGASYEGLRQPAYLVIPLLMLMGEFIARSDAVSDVSRVLHRQFRSLPGGAALAAAIGQGLYSFVASASASSAAGFTRITYPALKRDGYDGGTALGLLASSAAVGALIGQLMKKNTKGTVIGAAAGAAAGAVAAKATEKYDNCLPVGAPMRLTLSNALFM